MNPVPFIIGCAIIGYLLVLFVNALATPKVRISMGAYLLGAICGACLSASLVL